MSLSQAATEFLTGRPAGVSSVSRSAGLLTSWVENGFNCTVRRDQAGLPYELVAERAGRGLRLTQSFAYSGGLLIGMTGDTIPTVFRGEVMGGQSPVSGAWYPLAQIPRPPLVIFGDSRIAQMVTDSGLTKHITSRAALQYLQILAGGAFNLVQVAGVSGDTITQGLARFDNAVGGPLFGNGAAPGVSPYLQGTQKGLLITWLGVNDINTGRTLAAMQADAQAIIAKAQALNCYHVWINEPPAGATQGFSAAQKGKIVAWNRWLLTQPVIVVDAYSLAIDPSSATMLPATSMMNDNSVHPANLLGRRIGVELYSKISPLFQPVNLLPSSAVQVSSFDSGIPQKQVLPMLGTNVAATASGAVAAISGTMPTGCGFFGGGAATIVSVATNTAASGFGNVWEADITFASGADSVQMNLPRSEANFSGGETVYGAFYVEITGYPAGAVAPLAATDNLKTFKAQLTAVDGVAATHIRSSGNENTGDTALVGNVAGTLVTLPITLAAGAPTNVRNSLYLIANGAGRIYVKVSRAALWTA